ncbi:MAG: OsmC family protein [Planctomycetota bacterium]|jgi:putative redox protein
MNIKLVQISESACESNIRDHRVICDRPKEKAGGNEGPMGGEYLLMGLGGCFTSNLLAAFKARNANVRNVELDIAATIAKAPARFSKIEISVSAEYEDRALMEKLLIISERGCIAANTVKDSVELSVSLSDTPA